MTTINTLIDFITQSYSQRKLLILFAGMCTCAFLFGVAGYFIGIGDLIEGTQERVSLLDVLFNYSEEQAYRQLTAYGEQGREVCLTSTLLLDSLFPLFFGPFFALLLAHLFQSTKYQYITLLPILTILVDYIENTHIALMLINFPEKMPWVAYTGSVFTNVKWGLIIIILLMISFGFFIKNRKNFERNFDF